MEERSSLFGIEPVVKRTYTKSGRYSKAASKTKRKRKKGLHYRKAEENTSFLSLAGYAVTRSSWTYERGPVMFDTGSLPIYVRPGFTENVEKLQMLSRLIE